MHQPCTLRGTYTVRTLCATTGVPLRTATYKNLITTAGKAAIAAALAAPSTANALRITHLAIGTGQAPVTAADTSLATESFRKSVSSLSFVAGQVFASTFITGAEHSGQLWELGLFIGGTGTAGSGTLLSKVGVNILTTPAENLAIDYTLELI